MKKIILNKVANRMCFMGIALILVVLMSSCNNYYFGMRLEGWKDLYLFNCSGDVVTIETSLNSLENGMQNYFSSGPYDSEPPDSISLTKRIEYYQWLFRTECYKEANDSLLIILEPEEGMRIIHKEWLIAPSKFRGRNLDVDNLQIITKSDTILARNREEILNLRFDKKCKDGIYYKTIKYGRHGTPIMKEKVLGKL